MKHPKIILNFLFSLYFLSTNHAFGQLKVLSSNGNVGVKTLSPNADLQVVGVSIFTSSAGWPTSCAFIRGNNNLSSATTPDYTWYNNDQTGFFHPAVGVIGFSISGVEKMRLDASGNVGIGGTSGSYKLYVSGSAYCTGSWLGSDGRFKKDIRPINSALEKVLKMSGTSYEFKRDEFKDYNFTEGRSFGFIAQELKNVLPEVVKLENNGMYSVNYDAIIPVLIEAIKEQEKKINQLQSEVSNYNMKMGQQAAEAVSSSENKGKLYQNVPNPFSQNTVVKFSVPEGSKSASLLLFDMNGTLKKSFPISSKGEGSLIINSKEFIAGMYYYSLIIDGKEVDMKKMILTE